MDFQFYPLRFEFVGLDSIFFPPGKATNVLRGALGTIFRGIACVPECRRSADSRHCEIRHLCPYAAVFEPVAQGPGPSGFADPPRPFVFRAGHLDGRAIRPGDPFHFDLNLFSLDPDTLAYFVLTFAALAREGLGPSRGKAELRTVRRLPVGKTPAGHLPGATLYSASTHTMSSLAEPVTLSLEPDPTAPPRIRVEFVTPLELKQIHRVVDRPEFGVLFARIRDRIANLRKLYGAGPLELDFQGSNERAALVRMTDCRMRREERDRRSSRTGQTHSIGGFVGTAEYEGDLAEFLPWLEAARYTGVGRQAVWGKGEIIVVGQAFLSATGF